MNKNIDNEIDDIIENFDLKPITDGLGFHHSLKEEKEVKVNLKKQSVSLKNELETRIGQLDQSAPKQTAVNMGELAPFYQDTPVAESIEPKIEIQTEEKNQDVQLATLPIRLCAWFMDITILLTSMLVMFTAIIFFADLPLEMLNVFMISDELFTSFMAITFMFYTFYFSFFDKTSFSTIGKRIFNIKVQKIDGSNISYVQAFIRACLTVASIPLLGLPLILNFQDKITDTTVVEK